MLSCRRPIASRITTAIGVKEGQPNAKTNEISGSRGSGAGRGIIAQDQVRSLVEFLESQRPAESETRFNLVNLCWYLGAAGALVAFALFEPGK
jgi:hypothetical protein